MPEKLFAAPLIYFDQAATSRPKADSVGEAMRAYIEDVCVNISRSAYAPSTEAAINALETRELLCALFGFSDPTHVVFTPGHTVSLNMVLKGILRPGDHALVSSLEHNAVMRPLTQLVEAGVRFDRIPMRGDDELDLDAAERLMRPNTKLCLVSHASNVSGTILPIEALAALCQRRGVYFAVDAAQTAGHLPIDLSRIPVDAFCVPGHKGLRGPGGVAAMLLGVRFAAELEPLITGGTGSDSN
ncbi:MAG: aminotransferase class V-fold PLP-dependent enzyme, partial [Clostridiaceae bacterium]